MTTQPDSYGGTQPLYAAATTDLVGAQIPVSGQHTLLGVVDFTVARLSAVTISARVLVQNIQGSNPGLIDFLLAYGDDVFGSGQYVRSLALLAALTTDHTGPISMLAGDATHDGFTPVSFTAHINPPTTGPAAAALWCYRENANGNMNFIAAGHDGFGQAYQASVLEAFYPST